MHVKRTDYSNPPVFWVHRNTMSNEDIPCKKMYSSTCASLNQVLERLSGLGTHFIIAALHKAGASKRLKVVTLRIRR